MKTNIILTAAGRLNLNLHRWLPSWPGAGKRTLLRAGLALLAAAAPLVPGPALGQVNQVANWTGGNTSPHGLWGNPAKWDGGLVPINNPGTNFVVLVPDSAGIDFDRGTGNFIQAFSLGSSAELYFGPGQALTVSSDAQLGGLISATGTNSAFWSLATNAIFFGYPRLLANDGGRIGTAISSYSYTVGSGESAWLLKASGTASLISLSSLRTIQVNQLNNCCSSGSAWIGAQNGGRVDLSGLDTVIGPNASSWAGGTLTFSVITNGTVDLSSLRQIIGRTSHPYGTWFNVDVPYYELPSLAYAQNVTFNVAPGRRLAAPSLGTLDDAQFVLATGSTFEATNLVSLINSEIGISAERGFVTKGLLNIDNSHIWVTNTTYTNIQATSYHCTIGAGETPALFQADGVQSTLRLSSIRMLEMDAASYCCEPGNGYISARNSGLVDLSELDTIVGPDANSWGSPNLVFSYKSSGSIDLSSLREIRGRSAFPKGVRFEVDVPLVKLPSLETAQNAVFQVGAGCSVLLPYLESLNKAQLAIGFAGAISAPVLNTMTESEIALSPGQTFSHGSLTNVDGSRFSTFAGSLLSVAAPIYRYSLTPSSATLLLSDGRGSLLDFAATLVLQIDTSPQCCTPQNGYITARNEGRIDFSGLETIIGPYDNSWGSAYLVLTVDSTGSINLPLLREIVGRGSSTGGIMFQVGSTNWVLPVLLRADRAGFSINSQCQFTAPSLQSIDRGSIVIGFDGAFVGTNLTAFTRSSLTLGPGQTFASGALANVDSSSLFVLGGKSLAVTATAYANTRTDTAEMLKADGEANGVRSYLDLRSVRNVACNGGTIVASGRGVVDLSNAVQIAGTSGNSSYWLEAKASGAGELRLGDAMVSGYAKITLQGDTDRLVAGGLDLRYPARLSVGTGGEMALQRNFIFDNTAETDVALDSAVVRFAGLGGQSLEVGGRDTGTGVTAANFGLGVLVVGAPGQPSTVKLLDLRNNGHRGGTAGTNEALYLYGTNGANGLRLLGGSKLVLNGLRAYARVGGTMTLLNSLIPPGQNSVAFDQGIIVNSTGGGPAILAMTPNSAVIPTVDHVDVTFDIPTQAASFTPADVVITGPTGAIAASSVLSLGGNAYRIAFPAQSAHGSYTVRVGPNISDASGLVTQMDQNQNGLTGEVDDVFTGTFAIDTQPAQIVSAWGLQGGNRIGVRFNEALNPVTATNAVNYLVNSVVPTSASFGPDSQSIVLAIAGATVGESFTLSAANVGDVVSNAAPVSATGRLSPLTPMDVGTVGSNPREAGNTVTFDGVGFDATASGAIGSSPDGCQYVYESRPGDFDLRVQLARLDWKNNSTEAGLMARESSAANARFVMLVAYPTNGANAIYLNQRATAGSAWVNVPGQSNNAGVPFPNAWLRLKREGTSFKAYRGTNGTDWVQIGEVTNALPASLLVGMATASYNNTVGQSTLAQYRNYGDFAPSILSQPQTQTVAEGANVSFGVVARGQAPLAYQWFFNNAPLAGQTNDVLLRPSVALGQGGNYFVTVGNSIGVATSTVAVLTVYGTGTGGFEGDVSPRPTGNNVVTVTDWSQVGLFVAGLDTPVNGNEFARADCAPRSSLGNGKLTVSDWTQAARYAAGLDPLTPTGGVTNGLLGGSVRAAKDAGDLVSPRQVRFVNVRGTQGSTITVPVEMTAAGNENALGFSVVFDATRLRWLGASADAAPAGTFLQVNTNQAAAGRVGIVLALPAAQSYSAGTVTVARVSFVATEALGAAAVEFADGPVVRELASAAAEVLPVVYQNGAAIVVARPRLLVPEIQPGVGVVLRLLGDDATDYVIEASANAAAWTAISTNRPVGGSAEIRDAGAVGQPARFYRAKVRE